MLEGGKNPCFGHSATARLHHQQSIFRIILRSASATRSRQRRGCARRGSYHGPPFFNGDGLAHWHGEDFLRFLPERYRTSSVHLVHDHDFEVLKRESPAGALHIS